MIKQQAIEEAQQMKDKVSSAYSHANHALCVKTSLLGLHMLLCVLSVALSLAAVVSLCMSWSNLAAHKG